MQVAAFETGSRNCQRILNSGRQHAFDGIWAGAFQRRGGAALHMSHETRAALRASPNIDMVLFCIRITYV